jgi:uncharacterized membrane protein YkoI
MLVGLVIVAAAGCGKQSISKDDAIGIAMKQNLYPDQKAEDAKLINKNGRQVWEITISGKGFKSHVEVDAETGKVLEINHQGKPA